MTSAAFGGGVFIADTSVWTRSRHPVLRDAWTAAHDQDAIAVCSIVVLELLYTARNLAELHAVSAELNALREIRVTVSVQRAAIGALHELATRGAGHQRVPAADVLIAAAAQEAGVGVLHYDRHFDRLAEVLEFDSRWAAAPGTL
jgi:predicted nucleic acid-binding protein